jgi:NADH:ubiquinone oxidoreductase subunit 4 (subunit M)
MVPLLVLMVYMGVFPKPFLARSEEAVKAIKERVMHQAGGTIEKTEVRPNVTADENR